MHHDISYNGNGAAVNLLNMNLRPDGLKKKKTNQARSF